MSEAPPKFPAGEYVEPDLNDALLRSQLIEKLAEVPDRLRNSVQGLGDDQLDTKYNNWTIRQIVHHIADSHLNWYVRFKWALTEDSPLIKAYDESRWSELPDATEAPIEMSLAILDGIHARWTDMLRRLDEADMEKVFFHPELARTVSLKEALPSYVWHADHHTSQIDWVREKNGWN